MANRYWTKNPQRKITAGKGPVPGNTGPKPLSIPESTAKWNLSGASPSRNANRKAGYMKVKHSVKTSI